MIVNPSDHKSAIKLLDSKVEILEMPINDAWCRDSGAIFLLNDKNQLGGVDSDFNCWGYKENYELDDKVAKFMIDYSNSKYFKNNMVLEGGSIHVNGKGTLITTEQCLLNKNRNPDLSKNQIEYNYNRFNLNEIQFPIEIRFRNSSIDNYKFWRLYAGLKYSKAISRKYKFENLDN